MIRYLSHSHFCIRQLTVHFQLPDAVRADIHTQQMLRALLQRVPAREERGVQPETAGA